MNNNIAIGKIRTAHGIRGFVKVLSFSGEYKHFKALKSVLLVTNNKKRVYEIEEIVGKGASTVLKLAGIDNPEDAKALANSEIWVDRKFATKCAKNEFYYSDLVGCEVFCDDELKGSINIIYENGPDAMLEIIKLDETKSLVPFNKHFVGKVDTNKKYVEILDKWLLDEN